MCLKNGEREADARNRSKIQDQHAACATDQISSADE